jgi:hypothetical protein
MSDLQFQIVNPAELLRLLIIPELVDRKISTMWTKVKRSGFVLVFWQEGEFFHGKCTAEITTTGLALQQHLLGLS